MTSDPLVSVVVNNFNYAAFLKHAIDSALQQTYSRSEVVVVDDGSTDDSRQVIAGFGSRVSAILKPNEGQASAFNDGFQACHGDVVVFLDADDTLLPYAVERAVEQLRHEDVVKVHWPLWEVDVEGNRTGRILPPFPLLEGNLLPEVLQYGVPRGWRHGLGHAWNRRFLERVMPVRECGDKHGADAYLCALSPIYGRIGRIDEPLGCYRTHQSNFARGREARYRLERDARRYPFLFHWIEHFLAERGIDPDPQRWSEEESPYAWTLAALALENEIETLDFGEDDFILVDDGRLGAATFPRARPMMEQEGQYWGPPENDEAAIQELERQRTSGATHIVFAASSFWWLAHYGEFYRYLELSYNLVKRNKNVIAYDLRRQREKACEKIEDKTEI
jgi:hypothetical protein